MPEYGAYRQLYEPDSSRLSHVYVTTVSKYSILLTYDVTIEEFLRCRTASEQRESLGNGNFSLLKRSETVDARRKTRAKSVCTLHRDRHISFAERNAKRRRGAFNAREFCWCEHSLRLCSYQKMSRASGAIFYAAR